MRNVLLVLCLVSLDAAAAGVGFAQATGYFKKDTRPTLYQPLNLLDAVLPRLRNRGPAGR